MGINDIIQSTAALGGLIIGFVTIRIVLVTLEEQVDLNRAQFKLLEIESNRAAREIRPFFQMVAVQSAGEIYSFTTKCLLNNAYNVKCESTLNFSSPSNNFTTKQETSLPTCLVNQSISGQSHKISPLTDYAQLICHLTFQDEDGRDYEQTVTFESNFSSINNPAPKLISASKLNQNH